MISLDAKLAEIRANPASSAFILADAKDADMAFHVRTPERRSYCHGTATRCRTPLPRKSPGQRLAYHRTRLARQFGEPIRNTQNS